MEQPLTMSLAPVAQGRIGALSVPTQWVFIDDQLRFLEAVEAYLPHDQIVHCFDTPRAALDYVSNLYGQEVFRDWLGEASEQLMHEVSISDVTAKIVDRKRFGFNSVVICDYAMPGMNGIELFKQCDGIAVKKILLTGVADERVAVEAFNDGVIDRYVRKSDADALDKVIAQSRALAGDMFYDASKAAFDGVPALKLLLGREAFRRFFFQQLQRLDGVEYYYSQSPRGFLMLGSDGEARFLALLTENEIGEQAERANALGHNPAFATEIAAGRKASFLFEEPVVSEDYDWAYNTIDLAPVPDCAGWHYGIHDAPPMDVDFDPEIASFNAYLEGYQPPSP